MRTIIILIILLTPLIGMNFVNAQNTNFTIDVKIAGIEKGDTLRFNKVVLPMWTLEPKINIVVKQKNKTKYNGKLDHSQLYMLEYLPATGEAPICDRQGLSFIITTGKNEITGIKDYIYYSSIKNSIYDEQLRAILSSEDSIGCIRGDIMKELSIARIKNDSVEIKSLTYQFNNFYSLHKDALSEVGRLRDAYNLRYGNEYTASEIAQQSYKPIEELNEMYEKLSPQGKASYYGRYVQRMITSMEVLTIGNDAPELTLINTNGNQIKISDFKGKYLLIYNFGLCPGSFQMDSRVAQLYNERHNELEVIGITESFRMLESVNATTTDDDEIFGMNVKKVLNGMLAHPWINEVESSVGDNKKFIDIYCAVGLPYFIFISPEGKIVSRAIGDEAFNIACKTLNKSN